MSEYKIEVKESALEEAFRQGGDLRREIVGDDIWAPNRYREFANQSAAFEWKDTLRELDTSGGNFYFRGPKYNGGQADADQHLVYRE